MSAYQLALFGHIAGTIILFASLTSTIVTMFGMRRSRSVGQLRRWVGLAGKADKLLPLGAGLLLLTGLFLVLTQWGWGYAWVNVSLATLILVIPLVPGIIVRKFAAIHEAAQTASDGALPAAIQAATHDPLLWASVSILTALSISILFLMSAKPDTLGSIATVGIALLAGLASALPVWRGRSVLG